MKFRHKYILLIHLLLWVILFIPISFSSLIIYENSPEIIEKIIPNVNYNYLLKEAIVNLTSLFITFYLFYFVLFKWLVEKTNIKNILFSLLLIVVVYFFEGILLDWISKDISSTHIGASAITITRIILFAFKLGFALGLRAMTKYFAEKKKRQTTENLHEKSQLDLFRAKVNPHFLFNTLNNIDALIHSDPEKASEVLIKLSDQMRYIVYESDNEKTSLEKELNFVSDYIFLEKLRTTKPDLIQLEIKGDIKTIRIPPMLFIVFIENAFKHRSTVNMDVPVKVIFLIEGEWLNMHVSNPIDENRIKNETKYSGVGLPLIKKRLHHLFADNHRLLINEESNIFTVDLAIKII